MYAIAQVILGTILPWGNDDGDPDGTVTEQRLNVEYGRAIDPDWTDIDVTAYEIDPATCQPRWDRYFQDVILEEPEKHGWEKNYHGASVVPSAFVGVELHEFDESDHFEFSRLTEITFTPEQLSEACAKYDKLPMAVRAILPPFSVYILWSTS
jgi:hypothetical protein